MRELLQRCWTITKVIISSRYPYSKFRLWVTWLRLILNSVKHHKITTAKNALLSEYIFDCEISFTHYGSLIDQFEELFIEQTYFVELANRQPLIVDVGSNIGISILYFKTLYPGAQIIAFEPDPDTYELLKRNIKQNDFNDVHIHEVAASDVEGDAELFRSASSMNSSLYSETRNETITVKARKLSGFIGNQVHLLKIDIEGSEGAVIAELIQSGKIEAVQQIIIEHHPHINGLDTGELIGKLARNNFKVTSFKNQLHPESHEVLVFAERQPSR